MSFRFFALLCCLVLSLAASAQSDADLYAAEQLDDVSHLVIHPYQFSDKDHQRIFLDFEAIGVNLEAVRVINSAGEVMWSDDVSDLPTNVIYELDYSTYPTGAYTVVLRSGTGQIKKTLTVE